MLLIEDNAQRCSDELTDDGGVGGTLDAHGGAAEETEDHNGIKNDIDDGADTLNVHGDEGLTGALQHALSGNFHKNTDGADADDGEVIHPVLCNDGRNTLLHGKIEVGTKDAKQRKRRSGAYGKQQTDIGNLLGALAVFLSQTAGKQSVHAHAGAGGKGDHQVLNGECQ